MSKKGHIFISYSSKDIMYVNQIVKTFDQVGVKYWKAPELIPAGSNYAKEIPRAINDCDVFLLVLSATSQKSIWVEKEIDMAICCRKHILPIKIDESELSDMFKFYLNNVQVLQMTVINDKLSEMNKLIESIAEAKDMEVPEITYKSSGKSKNTNKSNALRYNKIPLQCDVCGGVVKLISLGVYRCEKCGNESYDDFYKIRSFIERHGPAPALIISKNTGVSMESIKYFRENGYFGEAR